MASNPFKAFPAVLDEFLHVMARLEMIDEQSLNFLAIANIEAPQQQLNMINLIDMYPFEPVQLETSSGVWIDFCYRNLFDEN